MANKIIELPDSFVGTGEVKGFVFHKLHKGNAAYIYEVTDPDMVRSWYEVIKRVSTPIFEDFENRILSEDTERERYPKAKDGGRTSWTYVTLKEALAKFNELEEQYKKGEEEDDDIE